jgi:predicted 3-demethylubiquinone-9 3-methyltransferase (glyoxalase superfamily)
MMQNVVPFIWYQGQAEEAMNYYVETFPNSKIIQIDRYTGDMGIPHEESLRGKVLTGVFEVSGLQMMCLDGGEEFKLEGAAISFMILCKDQEELDGIWEKLMDGGTPMQCGWITDKFGVTWQIVPRELDEMMGDESATHAQKLAVTQAMMPMVKLDAAKLREAFESAK